MVYFILTIFVQIRLFATLKYICLLIFTIRIYYRS